MPTSRTSPASARSHPQDEARRKDVSNPPKTPARTLGVRNATQVTPLTGNARKRQKDGLRLDEDRPPPIPENCSPSRANLASKFFGVVPPPIATTHTPDPPPPAPSAPCQTAPQPLDKQGEQPEVASRTAAASGLSSADTALRSSRARTETGRKDRPATHTPIAAPPRSPSTRPGKTRIPERLKGYALLGASASAFDVASRGGIKDKRVFVLLPEAHPARSEDYWTVRDRINQMFLELGSDSHVASVDVVKTGLALTPRRRSSADELMQHADDLKRLFDATDVTPRIPAIIRVITGVPVFISSNETGTDTMITTDHPFLEHEIKMALDAPLVCPPRRMCKPDDLANHKTTSVWVAIDGAYPDAARPRSIRLMQKRCALRPFTHTSRSPPSSPPCENCWQFGHSIDNCTHDSRCQHCSSTAHTTDQHTCSLCNGKGKDKCIPFCGNCTGPHTAGDSSCKYNPIFDPVVNGSIVPTGQRLHLIKQAATKDRREALKNLQLSSLVTSP
ncbi:hypothetical protein CF319_g9385 [Tilletia indica]|nr:hypothetical protein CF319_g9385 [Tilletia indica]